jgi:hypothetical protein
MAILVPIMCSGVGWDWVHLLRGPLIGPFYQTRMIDDDDECGAVGGMRIERGNRSTRRKPAICPPQIPHYQTWARTRTAVVGSRRLTAWAMARPVEFSNFLIKMHWCTSLSDKGKAIPITGRGGSQAALRLSALSAGRPLPPGRFLVLISVSGGVDPRAIVRLEGLGQLKNPMNSSGIEPATFRLVA